MVAEPTLKSLRIAPSPEDMEKIGEQLLKYIPIDGRDVGKVKEGETIHHLNEPGSRLHHLKEW